MIEAKQFSHFSSPAGVILHPSLFERLFDIARIIKFDNFTFQKNQTNE